MSDDKPAGYYARIEIKNRYESRRAETQRFNKLVEAELEAMGLDSERDIPTAHQIQVAESRAEDVF